MRIYSSNKVQNPNFGRLVIDRRLANSIKESPELDALVQKTTSALKNYEWGDVLMILLPGTVAGIGYYTRLRQPLKDGDQIKQKYIKNVDLDSQIGLTYNITDQDFHEPITSKTYCDNIYYYTKNHPLDKQDSLEKAMAIVDENERVASETNLKLTEEIAEEKEFQSEVANYRDEYIDNEY